MPSRQHEALRTVAELLPTTVPRLGNHRDSKTDANDAAGNNLSLARRQGLRKHEQARFVRIRPTNQPAQSDWRFQTLPRSQAVACRQLHQAHGYRPNNRTRTSSDYKDGHRSASGAASPETHYSASSISGLQRATSVHQQFGS